MNSPLRIVWPGGSHKTFARSSIPAATDIIYPIKLSTAARLNHGVYQPKRVQTLAGQYSTSRTLLPASGSHASHMRGPMSSS